MVQIKTKLSKQPPNKNSLFRGLKLLSPIKGIFILRYFIKGLYPLKKGQKTNISFDVGDKNFTKEVEILMKRFSEEWSGGKIWKIIDTKKTEYFDDSKKEKCFNLSFKVTLQDGFGLLWLLQTYMDNVPKYPYGVEKQKQIIGESIFETYQEFQNDIIPFSTFDYCPKANIQLIKILRLFEKEGLIKIRSFGIYGELPLLMQNSEWDWPVDFKLTFSLFITEKGKRALLKYKEPKEIPEAKTLPDIPDNIKWNKSVIIQFIDGYIIKIEIPPDFSERFDYKDMGFEDERRLMPNKQWEVLQDFAKFRGEISKKDKFIDRKQVSLLSKKLREKFGIKDNPIYWNKKNGTYTTKFTILPEEDIPSKRIKFSDKKELDFLMSKSDEEIKKHYKNQEEGYKPI